MVYAMVYAVMHDGCRCQKACQRLTDCDKHLLPASELRCITGVSTGAAGEFRRCADAVRASALLSHGSAVDSPLSVVLATVEPAIPPG